MGISKNRATLIVAALAVIALWTLAVLKSDSPPPSCGSDCVEVQK